MEPSKKSSFSKAPYEFLPQKDTSTLILFSLCVHVYERVLLFVKSKLKIQGMVKKT